MTTTARKPSSGSPAYFAHSSGTQDTESWQALSDHLENTGSRAAGFLDRLGFGDMARTAGLLHDLGKYTSEFQRRLAGDRSPCDHSTAGAQVAVERLHRAVGKVLAYCIAGHHTGLANGVKGDRISSLEDRLAKQVSLDPVWEDEIEVEGPTPPKLVPRDAGLRGFCMAFFTRMVFSALVDADYLDTEDLLRQSRGKLAAAWRAPTIGLSVGSARPLSA